MEATSTLEDALDALRGVGVRFPTASDDELLADLAGWEAVGRLVDARRIAAAAEVDRRSPVRSGTQSLAFRRGAKDGETLVADLTGVRPSAAKQRVGLGAALAPAVTLLGDTLPSRYPTLTAAVNEGRVGLDSARVIVDAAQYIRRRVPDESIRTMVDALTEDALSQPFEIVRDNASWWMVYLDQDGPAPDDTTRRRQRRFRFGRAKLDGTTSFFGIATAEDVALLKELFASRRRGSELDRTPAGGDPDGTDEAGGPDSIETEWVERAGPDGTPRSREQQDFDTLIDTIKAGMAAEKTGAASTSPLHDVIIQVSATDLESRTGNAWTAGVMAGLPITTVERIACTEGVRLLVSGDQGEPLWLGRSTRLFSAAQKKALHVAAGGRCQYPGCTTPAPYLEAHHIAWWDRDAGPTDMDQGILLCSYHHHLVHAHASPVEIIRWHDDVYIVPTGWRGPPGERMRRQRGPVADPRITTTLRRFDPPAA